MPRSDAFNKSPDESLPDLAVLEPELIGADRTIALTSALIAAGSAAIPRTGAVALMTAVLEEAIRSCFSATPQVRAEAEVAGK